MPPLGLAASLGLGAPRLATASGTGGGAPPDTNAFGTDVDPEFHFDAGMINGVDATNNPDNGDCFASDVSGGSGGVWTSRSGSVVTLVQTESTLQPDYYTSGWNSKPYFDWTSDYLAIDGTPTISDEFTIFAIAEQTGIMSFTGTHAGSTGIVYMYHTNGNDYLWYNAAGNDYSGRVPFPSDDNSASKAAYESITRMYMVTRDASDNSDLWVDGNNQNTDLDATTDLAFDCEFLGRSGPAAYSHVGHIYEIAVWNSDLSVDDKNAVISYVNDKYWPARAMAGRSGKLNADVSAGAGTVQITGFESPYFPTTGSAFIKGDVFSWTGKSEPSPTIYNLTGVTGLTTGHTAYTAPGYDTTSVIYESIPRETF